MLRQRLCQTAAAFGPRVFGGRAEAIVCNRSFSFAQSRFQSETDTPEPSVSEQASAPNFTPPPESAAPAEPKGGYPPLPFFIPRVKAKHKPQLVLADAVAFVKEEFEKLKAQRSPKAKGFNETVDLAIQLGTDPKRSDQAVRGLVSMPHGVGRKVNVVVFARDDHAKEALAAGADLVGAEDLVARVKNEGASCLKADTVIAHPSMMPVLAPVARLLGPKGLMPNPKLGTLTTDLAKAVQAAKHGQVEFRQDKYAIVHVPVGKAEFAAEELVDNISALATALLTAKPKNIKGQAGTTAGFFKRISMSSTQGPSVTIKKDSFIEVAEAGMKDH